MRGLFAARHAADHADGRGDRPPSSPSWGLLRGSSPRHARNFRFAGGAVGSPPSSPGECEAFVRRFAAAPIRFARYAVPPATILSAVRQGRAEERSRPAKAPIVVVRNVQITVSDVLRPIGFPSVESSGRSWRLSLRRFSPSIAPTPTASPTSTPLLRWTVSFWRARSDRLAFRLLLRGWLSLCLRTRRTLFPVADQAISFSVRGRSPCSSCSV